MALEIGSKKRSLKFGVTASTHGLDLWVPSALLHNRRQNERHFFRNSNSVHPATGSLPLRSSTTHKKITETVHNPTIDSTASPLSYVVKVRVLHGIDLHVLNRQSACQHTLRPVANITVNDSSVQSCTATQHARNHSIWKKHELKFQVHNTHQVTSQDEEVPSSIISIHLFLSCAVCTCGATSKKLPSSVAIGEVGELQVPAKTNENYEISRFFPVIRRQRRNSQSAVVLLPAGKVKLWIRVEGIREPILRPEVIKRPPFALPTNFGEALQLKRKQLKAAVVPEDNFQKMNHQDTSQINSDAANQLLKELSVETASDQIDMEHLNVENCVGEGIHSCVSRGVYKSDCIRQVAVKEFRHQHVIPPVNVLRAFQQEFRVLKRCRSQNGHQHVVELVGVILQPRLIIVMEYFDRGSLAQCLQDEVAWSRMSMKQKAMLGLTIAKGLAWLHEHNMIHRDVKSHNILVDGDLASNSTVKVGDLGSAVEWQQHEPLLLEEVGSSGYTAPEIFTQQGYDSKVDVWSFGVVLWELASASPRDRTNPFTGMAGDQFVEKALSGCRPKLTHEHQLCVGPVVEKCWEFEPSARPTMIEVVNQLVKICQGL